MTSNPSKKSLVHHLIRAARGQAPKSTKQHSLKTTRFPPLPCFELHRHHFGRIVGSGRCVNDDDHNSTTNGSSPTIVPTPSDFHSHLCYKIRSAQDRVILASLYIGVGSNRAGKSGRSPTEHKCKEDELLDAIHYAASNSNVNKIQILLDANRALRKVSFTKAMDEYDGNQSTQSHSSVSGKNGTCSAKAVHAELIPFLTPSRATDRSGVFLFPVNNLRLCSLLPSPLGEVAGVFHIKAYIIDNELILSGANLSEEYFTNRLDRYMSFVNGAGGLVDFYANLVDILSRYAVKYDENLDDSNMLSLVSTQYKSAQKQELEASLIDLFNGERRDFINSEKWSEKSDTINPIAYAIPTFQMPQSFLGRPPNFHSDAAITRDLLESALEHDSSSSVRLSSAYLNLTPSLLSVLTKFGRNATTNDIDNEPCDNDLDSNHGFACILTAGTISHGFAPKKESTSKQSTGIVGKIKDSVPVAFLILVKQVAATIIARGGKVLLYERLGWTFHAKGVWITRGELETKRTPLINNASSLVGTIIGSGNYGARSEDLDVESNLILIFNESTSNEEKMSSSSIETLVAAEWNEMCKHGCELTDVDVTVDRGSKVMNVALYFLRRFL